MENIADALAEGYEIEPKSFSFPAMLWACVRLEKSERGIVIVSVIDDNGYQIYIDRIEQFITDRHVWAAGVLQFSIAPSQTIIDIVQRRLERNAK